MRKNSINNIAFSIGSLVTSLLSFVSCTVFIYILGTTHLGVNSLMLIFYFVYRAESISDNVKLLNDHLLKRDAYQEILIQALTWMGLEKSEYVSMVEIMYERRKLLLIYT